jgi:hypothetical protein
MRIHLEYILVSNEGTPVKNFEKLLASTLTSAGQFSDRFFITSFYLKWLWHGGQNLWWKKKLSLNCPALVRVLARSFSNFLTGVPPLGTRIYKIHLEHNLCSGCCVVFKTVLWLALRRADRLGSFGHSLALNFIIHAQ